MVKVKFKIINPDYILFKNVEYLECIDPRIELRDRNILIIGKNGEIVGVFPCDFLVMVASVQLIDGAK
jgi:hypothetical protein